MTTLGKTLVLCSCLCAFAAGGGCTMYEAAGRNAILEPAAQANRQLTCVRDHLAAKGVWESVVACEPGQNYSKDYEEGFKCGYADYLKEGGYPAAKSMPPYRYWARGYETPEGKAAVDDWYAGYERGQHMAHDEPLRDLATMPTRVGLAPSKDKVRIADVDYSGTKAEQAASVETLPPPAPGTELKDKDK